MIEVQNHSLVSILAPLETHRLNVERNEDVMQMHAANPKIHITSHIKVFLFVASDGSLMS